MALSVRNDDTVMSVASAVRRKPPRSREARGVTATVSSHNPAASGRSASESVSTRTMASPPGLHVSADVRIEKSRKPGDTAITSAVTTIASAAATAARRSRSTSTRRTEAPMTTTGKAASAASHTGASFIPIAFVCHRGPPRHDRIAQPAIETGQQARGSGERVNHDAIERAVKESAFERDQEQAPADTTGCHRFEKTAASRRAVADGVFHAVEIVEDVRRAQKLQQSKRGMPGEMDERDPVPPERDLDDDDADLRERGI